MATSELQSLVDSYRECQYELQKAQQSSQQFIQQQHENEMVLKELEEAGEDSKIYKLIGPALIPQDHLEATSNVKKRLELIENEVKRLEDKMKNLSEKAGKMQARIQEAEASAK